MNGKVDSSTKYKYGRNNMAEKSNGTELIND